MGEAGLSALDWLAIAAYAGVVLWIGVRAARGHGGASDLLLGSRSVPAWAVLLSLVATELSAATFIGVPHAAFAGDWSYLQLAFGALIAKGVLAWHVVPLYHRLGVVTVYGYLQGRYGPHTRRVAALCFVLGRILASGVRLFIAALAFATVTGWRIELAIVVAGLLAGAYTLLGGIRAVIWTDAFQAAVFVVSASAVVIVLGLSVPGGLEGILDAAGEDKTRVFHLRPWLSLSSAQPFLVGLIGGFFLTLATHATDHDMVQRLLTTKDGRSGGAALAASALLNFPLSLLFLFIGTGLAVFYASPAGYDVSDTSRVLPIFALHELPSGVRGVLFAGLFAAAMSSLDSAVCAIATTWVIDVSPGASDDAALARRTRWTSAGFCLLLIGAAIAMSAYERALGDSLRLGLVQLALSAMTLLYGGLLGVFGLGFLNASRGSDASAIAGLAAGACCGALLFVHPLVLGETVVAWTWWVPISACVAAAATLSGRRSSPAR